MMKASKRSLLWPANYKALLLLVAFVLEASVVKASDQHVFTDTIPIIEHEGHILMPVTINHELKHLVFDTGAIGVLIWGDKKPFITKWTENTVDTKNHTKEFESGLVLAEFGSRCDSLIALFKPLPTDSLTRRELLRVGDGLMGFCPLIRMGLDYFVRVDLQKGIMIVSNDHKRAKQTKGIKVRYKKCDELPTFMVRIGKKHRTRLPLDSGASLFCTVPTSVFDELEEKIKDKKVLYNIAEDFAIHDTAVCKRKVKAYKCDFAIKSFNVKDALIIDDPFGYGSVGEEIFHKAAISFDPWHRKIIFQPYDM